MNHRDAAVPQGDDALVESEIQRKGLTAPRITLEHVEQLIVDEQYVVFPGTTVTVCLLHLLNGHTVVGESACVSPENFDEQLGRDIARRNARDKIWALEGYLLRQRLHDEVRPSAVVGPSAEG